MPLLNTVHLHKECCKNCHMLTCLYPCSMNTFDRKLPIILIKLTNTYNRSKFISESVISSFVFKRGMSFKLSVEVIFCSTGIENSKGPHTPTFLIFQGGDELQNIYRSTKKMYYILSLSQYTSVYPTKVPVRDLVEKVTCHTELSYNVVFELSLGDTSVSKWQNNQHSVLRMSTWGQRV